MCGKLKTFKVCIGKGKRTIIDKVYGFFKFAYRNLKKPVEPEDFLSDLNLLKKKYKRMS